MATKKGWVETGKVTFLASATIDQYELVKVTGNDTCAPAGIAEQGIGVSMAAATVTGVAVEVLMLNHGGTVPGIIAASVTAGAKIFPYTGGTLKAATTATAGAITPLGICKSGATAAGDRIEWIPQVSVVTT